MQLYQAKKELFRTRWRRLFTRTNAKFDVSALMKLKTIGPFGLSPA